MRNSIILQICTLLFISLFTLTKIAQADSPSAIRKLPVEKIAAAVQELLITNPTLSKKYTRLTLLESELGWIDLKLRVKSERKNVARIVSNGQSQLKATPIKFVELRIKIRKLSATHEIKSIGGLFPSSRGGYILHLPFLASKDKRTVGVRRSFELLIHTPNQGTPTARIKRGRAIFPNKAAIRCGTLANSNSPITTALQSAPTLALLSPTFLNVAIVADSRFAALYGDDTASIIAVVLENVAQIYSDQLNMTLRLDSQTIYADSASDPFADNFATSTDLLEAFRTTLDLDGSSADVFELFTSGRGFLDAIGLAYTGTVCALPQFRVAWSDYASGFYYFVQTVAHETGHTLNCSHDTTDEHSLMSIGDSDVINPYFSTFSISEVDAFLTSNGSCVNADEGAVLPTPGSFDYPLDFENAANVRISLKAIAISKQQVKLKGKVRMANGTPLSNHVVQLVRKNGTILTSAITDVNGKYFFLRNRKVGKKFYTSHQMSLRTTALVTVP